MELKNFMDKEIEIMKVFRNSLFSIGTSGEIYIKGTNTIRFDLIGYKIGKFLDKRNLDYRMEIVLEKLDLYRKVETLLGLKGLKNGLGLSVEIKEGEEEFSLIIIDDKGHDFFEVETDDVVDHFTILTLKKFGFLFEII